MNDRQIIASVVERWKQSSIEDEWSIDSQDAEEAKANLREDEKRAKEYLSKCMALVPIYRSLAGPLMSPRVGVYADRIEQRVKDVEALMGMLRAGVAAAEEADREWEKFVLDSAKGEGFPKPGTVRQLPGMVKLIQIAKEAGKLHERFIKQDENSYFDWSLEEYLGSEAKVYNKIEKLSPSGGWAAEDFQGAAILYGVIQLLTDEELIQEKIEEARG